MIVKYYLKACGSGKCGTCEGIRAKVDAAAKKWGFEATVAVFKGHEAAAKAGVPELPAMVIEDELVASGYEPTEKELIKLFKKYK